MSSSGVNLSATLAGLPNFNGTLPIFAYGNSYSVMPFNTYTAGLHYLQRTVARLKASAVTSYGVSGTRIVDVLSSMVNNSGIGGCAAPVAGGLWPGTIGQRAGLIVIESLFNDIGHYPDMTLATAIPAALAGTNYRNGYKGMLRAALALASSDSRVEDSTAVFTGTWTQNSVQPYASAGHVAFTSTVGAKAAFTVTPAQTGPLAGKVYFLTYKLDPGVGAMAQMTIDVDGANSFTYTPAPWEQYKGQTAAQVNVAWDCVTINVPVDGNAHTVNVTHSGAAGQFLYADCMIVPSVSPNPIAFMSNECPPVAGPVWTGAQVGVWEDNQDLMIPDAKTVVAEFPNAVFVPSNMTSNGLYSGDGIHPNDRGHAQRSSDLVDALQSIKAILDAYVLQQAPNANFAKL